MLYAEVTFIAKDGSFNNHKGIIFMEKIETMCVIHVPKCTENITQLSMEGDSAYCVKETIPEILKSIKKLEI